MRDWKCTKCHHEGQGSREFCDWCNAPTQTLRETRPPPYNDMAEILTGRMKVPPKEKQH